MREHIDPLRLCCCHGHLDGLTLDEMAALGAPCPTAAYVKQAQAEAWDECTDAHHDYAIRQGLAFAHPPNPYRVFPPGQCPECGTALSPDRTCPNDAYKRPIPPAKTEEDA